MNLGRSFTTRETPDRARQLIGAYLERVGYRPAGAAPASVYKRGSRLGSLVGFSVKGWHVTATIEVAPGQDESTQVTVSFDIDTTGQIVIKKERAFWDHELEGVVAAANGTNVGVSPLAQAEERVRREARLKGGANWFYWIAGLSLLNSLMWAFDIGYIFFIGLGVTQLVDGFITGLVPYLAPELATLVRVAGLVVDVLIAGLFALFGFLAKKGHRWSLIFGAVLYALDTLIFLMVPDFMSIGFHVLGLAIILTGLRAGKEVAKAEFQPDGSVGE